MTINTSLRSKLLKNSTIKETEVFTQSELINNKDMVVTAIPMLNVALSGRIDGGLTSGITQIAGPSKHFKTGLGIVLMRSYLNRHKDAIVLFYDAEFGAPASYFNNLGVDTDRVVHTPIMDIEQLKHDIITQLAVIERGEKVFIFIDSIGQLASKKELEDAKEGKSPVDMTRAKSLKSLFRMITPYFVVKNIPGVVINHSYKTLEMFSKDVVGGGTGGVYGSDTIWIVGRQQDKATSGDKKIQGYHYVINIEKSRFLKEKSKIPITLNFDQGISKWGGLLDVAEEGKYVIKPKNATWQAVNPATGELLGNPVKDTDTGAFWELVFKNTDFQDYIKNLYSLKGFEGDSLGTDVLDFSDDNPIDIGEERADEAA